MPTPENFKSLAALVRAPACALVDDRPVSNDAASMEELKFEPSEEEAAYDDVRLFRARIAEALECALDSLCRDLTGELLARELMLSPVDVRAVCNGLIERYARDVPVAIRAHPHDCNVLGGFDAPIIADERLRPGDVMLDVANGTLDSSLAVRLEHVLCKRHG